MEKELFSKVIIAEGKGWITSRDAVFSEEKDPGIIDKLSRDPAIVHAVQIRKAKVFEQPFRILGDPKYEKKLRSFDCIEQGFNWALDAIMEGRSCTSWDYNTGEIKHIKSTRLYRKDISEGVGERDFKWFIQYPNATLEGFPLEPGKHLFHLVDNRDGQLGFGFGLNEALYHLYKFRTELLQTQMRYYYRFGTPTMVLKYDQTALSSHTTAVNNIKTMLGELSKSSIGDYLGIDSRHEIDFKEPSKGIGQDFTHTQDWIDRQIRKLILGTALSTDVGDSGSYTLGKKQYENLDAIVSLDRKLLASSITKWLLFPWWVNDGCIGEAPRLEFFEPDQGMDSEQINANVARLNWIAENKIDGKSIAVKEEEVYQALGFSMPSEEDYKLGKVITVEKSESNNNLGGLGFSMKKINNTGSLDEKNISKNE